MTCVSENAIVLEWWPSSLHSNSVFVVHAVMMFLILAFENAVFLPRIFYLYIEKRVFLRLYTIFEPNP